MAVVLGLDAILMRGTAGQTAATEVKNVKDLTLSMESGEADVTTRGHQWLESIYRNSQRSVSGIRNSV